MSGQDCTRLLIYTRSFQLPPSLKLSRTAEVVAETASRKIGEEDPAALTADAVSAHRDSRGQKMVTVR
jgi:hypothetical protein